MSGFPCEGISDEEWENMKSSEDVAYKALICSSCHADCGRRVGETLNMVNVQNEV